MLSYSRFLVRNILIKKGIYITVALFAILMIVITYLQIETANEKNMPFLMSISTFTKFYPFLFSSMFTTLIVIYVFKDGEEDGSELLIVSKPLKRSTIISSKFLIVISFMIAFHIFSFFIYLLSGVADKLATTKMLFQFAGSLTVGGFVVQLIVLSLVSLLGTIAGRVGTMIFGIMFSAIIPIVSFIITPLSKGQPVSTNFLKERVFVNANFLQDEKLEELEDVRDVSKVVNYLQIYNTRPNGSEKRMEDIQKFFEDYKSREWFHSVAPLDVWYQWGRFMSIFTSDTTSKKIDVQEWHPATIDPHYPPGSVIDVRMKPKGQDSPAEDRHVALFFDYGQLNLNEEFSYGDSKKYLDSLLLDLASLVNKHYIVNDVWNATEPSTYAEQLSSTPAHTVPMEPLTDSEKMTLKYLERLVSSSSFSDKLNNINLGRHVSLVTKTKMYLETIKFLKENNINLTGDMGIFNEEELRIPYIFPEIIHHENPDYQQWAFDADKPLPIFQSKPFISTSIVIAVWCSIMVALLATTIVVYSRRDFK